LPKKRNGGGVTNMTPDSKIYCEKVKMCRFSSARFFYTKIVQLAVAGERRSNIVVHLQRRVYEIGPDCDSVFSLVDHDDCSRWFAINSPYVYKCSSGYSFIGGVAKKKKPAKLRHLILLSRVTYLATMVEMLLQVICQQN